MLQKDPLQRPATIAEVAEEIESLRSAGSGPGPPAIRPRKLRERARRLGVAFAARLQRSRWPLVLLAALLASIATILVMHYALRAPVSRDVVRFHVPLPSELVGAGEPQLSPDGRVLAFAGTDAQGVTRIWLRALDSLEARALPGTEGTTQPFWSPDSRFLGFMSERKLRKIAISGGPPETICDASAWGGVGTWSEDGTILFARGGESEGIFAVSAAGGSSRVLVTSAEDRLPSWPRFLPGGRTFLYREITPDGPRIRLANADGSGVRDVMAGVSRVEYSPPGFLLFVRDTTLVARRFDAGTGELSGEPVAVAEGLATDGFGNAAFSASLNGTLVYRTGFATTTFVWLDRTGQQSAVVAESRLGLNNFDLSPDGRWLLFEARAPRGWELRLHDIQRGVTSVFAAEPGNEIMCPLFTPDRRGVLFTRYRSKNGSSQVVIRALDSAAEEQVVDEPSRWPCAEGFTPDGESVLANLTKGSDRYDVWRYGIGRPGSGAPVVELESSSSRPALSPDGRWLAFQGDESGRDEIYVTPLAGTGARVQISTHGGREPEWGPDGTELFYVSSESRLMRVAVQTGASFDAGDSVSLFTIPVDPVLGRNRYLVAPDGERFLVRTTPHGGPANTPVTVVLNWNR
jgi:eukaryotic-like serine/threonine-protein kinase